jgi:hypothetical protein
VKNLLAYDEKDEHTPLNSKTQLPIFIVTQKKQLKKSSNSLEYHQQH